jgi:hypothetical protein
VVERRLAVDAGQKATLETFSKQDGKEGDAN